MKKLTAILISLIAFATFAEPVTSTQGGALIEAETFRPAGSADTGSLRIARKFKMLYQLAVLGPTSAIDSGSLDLSGIEEYMVVVVNGNSTNTRAIVFSFQDASGSPMFTITPTACAASTTCTYNFGKGATGTGLTGGYALTPPAKFQLSASAPGAGAGNGSIAIYGR
jgi:hypothetical protein